MIPTVRKEIDDEWVEVYMEMKHPTTLKTQMVLTKYMKDIPAGLPTEEFKKALNNSVTIEDNSLMDDITILGQVKTWSFGEVKKEVLDNEVSENKRLRILDIMNGLYSPLPASGSGLL